MIALSSLQRLPQPVHSAPDELNQTLSDIQGFAMIGRYYAEKIRAACVLALFENTKNEQYRTSALKYLQQAQKYWNDYAAIYSIKNKPALYNRVGYVDVEKLKEKVQQDIDMVKNWKPGTNRFTMAQKTEVPFNQ